MFNKRPPSSALYLLDSAESYIKLTQSILLLKAFLTTLDYVEFIIVIMSFHNSFYLSGFFQAIRRLFTSSLSESKNLTFM